MHHQKKSSAFFIIEIIIVLVLITLLSLLLLPYLKTYSDQAKFQDVIRGANSLKPAVELCLIQQGNKTTDLEKCEAGQFGIPAKSTDYGGHLGGLYVEKGGTIFAYATSDISGPSKSGSDLQYILTPYVPNDSNAPFVVQWRNDGSTNVTGFQPAGGQTPTASTCLSQGRLC